MESQVTNTTYNTRTPIALPLSILFLIIGLILIFFIALYYIFWLPEVPPPACGQTNDCAINEVCRGGACRLQTCNSEADCGNQGACIGSYCIAPTCLSGNDCPPGTVCSKGGCVESGATCTAEADCYHLSCITGVCVQCNADTMCPEGQGCFSGGCRYPYAGETGAGQIFYESPAQANGNITAPPGYFCSNQTCTEGTVCGAGQECPESCSSCVNSVCRCTLGALLENCAQNTDCASGLCRETSLGLVCVPSGGECAFNYSARGCTGCCPTPAAPYCVDGRCSLESLGAPCGAAGMPPDLCNNPNALTGVPTEVPDGMGFFCVNGRCGTDPGSSNALCTPNSCALIQPGTFTCESVPTPTLTQYRCLATP